MNKNTNGNRKRKKISLNQFIINALSEKVSALQTVDIIEKKSFKSFKRRVYESFSSSAK